MYKMFLKSLPVLLICSCFFKTNAQYQSTVTNGEFGFTVGGAHYFGDLNTRASIARPKPSVGVFFRKQFNDYVGLRVSAHFAQLGFSDITSKNPFQKLRNLSFNSNIWELAVQGDFNFFKFQPEDPYKIFTPYLTLGVGVFSYDPYTYLRDEKIFLRNIGTEGQGSNTDPIYAGRKPYNSMAVCIPFGMGLKYSISEKVNLTLEASYRFTTTDYLDDVSTVFSPGAFLPNPDGTPSVGQLLSDRSYELDPTNLLGIEGRQRGFSKQKDSYGMLEVGLAIRLTSYRCPTAR
jgi:hypothetical protein